jgi:hypothetical protein
MYQDKRLKYERMEQRSWSADEIEILKEMLNANKSNKDISRRLGRPPTSVKSRVYKLLNGIGSQFPKFTCEARSQVKRPKGEKRQPDLNPNEVTFLRREQPAKYEPPSAQVIERDYRMKLSRPTTTAEFFGDPLPGYSALDRKRKISTESNPD